MNKEYKIGMVGTVKSGKKVVIRRIQNDKYCSGYGGDCEYLGSPVRNKIKWLDFRTIKFE